VIPTPNPDVNSKKKKQKTSHGRQSSQKYAERHGYKSRSNPRRRGGKWVSRRNAKE
jgi:hypothetical protein